jgi:hypothetical protein
VELARIEESQFPGGENAGLCEMPDGHATPTRFRAQALAARDRVVNGPGANFPSPEVSLLPCMQVRRESDSRDVPYTAAGGVLS